ncbi:MAG TPA: translation initiation factor IF-2 [Candidatus Paceibacterota bacterium]
MKKSVPIQPHIVEKPPVVAVMGHIDHGKSTLLDYIRKTNTTANEAGGITQHIAAYEVTHKTKEGKEGRITFIDTPGHEAFKGLRERGAKVADIAILVVSAEEGVKPQTLEALRSIKDAKVSYIIVLTKIDKPNASAERTKQSLAEHEIYIEGWGGDIPVVALSAVSGEGVPELLDMILLLAEVSELKADSAKASEGVVIESHRDNKQGVSATLIIKEGILETGMFIAAGRAVSPVRIIHNFLGKPIKSAGISNAVSVIGWSEIPEAGSLWKSFTSKKEAEQYAEQVKHENEKSLEAREETPAEEKVVIPLIIKSDVAGSMEAVLHEIKKIVQEKIVLKVVHFGIGDISENDVKAASGNSSSLLIGFNTSVDSKASSIAERLTIPIHTFTIIYKLTEFLETVIKDRTPRITVEESTGTAKIIRLFSKNKDKQVIGGKVEKGEIVTGEEVKIFRREAEIGKGRVKELQSKKIKVSEVKEGFEFGAMVESKFEISAGDRIEGFRVVEK